MLILTLMRVGLEPTARTIRKLIAGQSAMTDWEKSPTFVVLRSVNAETCVASIIASLFSLHFVTRDPNKRGSSYGHREIYRPLELLLYVGAASAVAESVLPTLISVPRAAINHIMRTIVTLCVIISAAVVVFKLKDKALREGAWRLELSG